MGMSSGLAAGVLLAAVAAVVVPVAANGVLQEYVPADGADELRHFEEGDGGGAVHEYIQIDGMIMFHKTTIQMHVPSDNPFPWGRVSGTIDNPARLHPVIIQMYQDGRPVHFAQANVQDDGRYEYKFRALNVHNGTVTRIFEGDYQVVIFKTVYVPNEPV